MNKLVVNFIWSILGLGILLMFKSCSIEDPNFALEPAITSVFIDKDTIVNLEESFTITIGFQDGDGDLGREEGQEAIDAFIVDSRTNFVDSLVIPFISPQGNVQSISGMLDFVIPSECCIPIEAGGVPCTPNAEYDPFDIVTFEVHIKDRAGNISNSVTTPALYIVCPQ